MFGLCSVKYNIAHKVFNYYMLVEIKKKKDTKIGPQRVERREKAKTMNKISSYLPTTCLPSVPI